MILGDIRQYLQQRRIASLTEVSLHFDITPDATRFALDYWVKKQKVREVGAACGSSCSGCGDAESNYQWIESGMPIQWLK